MHRISRNNILRKFFEMVADNNLSTEAELLEYGKNKQLEAHKVGLLTDEGIAARQENELMFQGLNYLATLKDTTVKSFLIDYFK